MNNLLDLARDCCVEWHGDQKRKYTGEEYWRHPFEVAALLQEIDCSDEVIAAGYLHDVLEDTRITEYILRDYFDNRVTDLVLMVTDVSKPEDGNRKTRKAMDKDHLAKADADGQTIKLADLISNTRSIVEHDPRFAKVYLREKMELLAVMNKGNEILYCRAQRLIMHNMEKLNA